MNKKLLLLLLITIIVAVPVFTTCTSKTSTTTSTQTATTQTTTSTPVTTSPPATQAHWWDKFGEPQYGGELNMRTSDLDPSFDSVTFLGRSEEWYEQLFMPDWTLDRNIWSFQFGNFVPEEYMTGGLAETWKWTDPKTLAITIHKGILWHDMPPVNGREFIADDIVFTFDRLMGTGHGYTTPNEAYTRFVAPIEKVTLMGTYSIEIKFKEPTPWSNMRAIFESIIQPYEAPEVVALGPHASNWKLGIGTGPYMIKDLVRNSVMTMTAYPKYWKTDERYPKNKLPYITTVKEIIIADDSAAQAALLTGKLDFMGAQTLTTKQVIDKATKDIVMMSTPSGAGGMNMRVDRTPFSDIRVRKALQLAINIPSIAKNYYSGLVPAEPVGVVNPGEKGYCYRYADWPQSLKDEYSFNPTQSKALLAEAGYPNGFNTNCVFSSDSTDVAYMEMFKAMFANIGVNVELRPMDRVSAENFTHAGKHDAMTGTGTAGTTPPQIAISTIIQGAVGNTGFINDPVINDCFAKVTAAADYKEAQKYCQEFDKQVITQHYWIVGPVGAYYAFWQPYLKGFSGEISPGRQGARMLAAFFYAARVWIDQNMKTSMGR